MPTISFSYPSFWLSGYSSISGMNTDGPAASAPPKSKSDNCPSILRLSECAILSSSVCTQAVIWLLVYPNESMHEASINASATFFFTPILAPLITKSSNDLYSPFLSLSDRISRTAPSPTFLMTERPILILRSPSVVKRSRLLLISGGRTSIPIAEQQEI